MTDANKVMNPQHLRSDPADIRDWRQQGNESTTFAQRSGRHPDPNVD